MPFGEKVDRPCTLVFKVPEELRTGSKVEFVHKLVAAVADHEISAIQFVPGFHVRITFCRLSSRDSVFRNGLRIDGVDVDLIEAESTLCYVYVHHLPVEVSDDDLRAALNSYGRTVSVDDCFFPTTRIRNGTRLVKMYLDDDIPTRFRVLRYPCQVWYRTQPRLCFICEKASHVAADCPLRGLCRKCRKPGHFARDCVDSPEEPSADVPDPPASDSPVPDTPASDPPVPDTPAAGSEEMETDPKPARAVKRKLDAVADPEPSSDAAPDSILVSQPSFPPSGVPVPDPVPVSMFNANTGFHPPVFSPLAPVRSAPVDVRDPILAAHSSSSMFYTEKLVPLDGSSPVLSHVVIDHGSVTCAVLEDSVTFEFARAVHYANCASSDVSCPSPPVCSAMPGVLPVVDLPPLPSFVTPALFSVGSCDSKDDVDAVYDDLCDAVIQAGLEPFLFTWADVEGLLPSDFASLSTKDQNIVRHLICSTNFREYFEGLTPD